MKKQPTYHVHELVEMVGYFGKYEMAVLCWLLSEEKERYSVRQYNYLMMVLAHRYGEIEIEENLK